MFLNKFLNNIVFFKVIIQSKYLALKRRFCLYFYKNYDPYPKVPSGLNFSPSKFHENYANNMFPKISFENTEDSKDIFQEKAREKIKNTHITYPGHIPRRAKESEMFGKNMDT